MTTELVVVLCTVPDVKVGAELARTLVRERFAACVNVLPGLTSIYRWKGEIHEDAEALLVIKTRRHSAGAVERAIKANHPYTTPEVIVLPIENGSGDYLAWLWGETARDPVSS